MLFATDQLLSWAVTLAITGSLLINEIAPRPHNSGHYTIEACECSQYENHLRAILGLPLGSTRMKVPSAIMVNLLGPPGEAASCNQKSGLI
jgi:phosphoribosylaminoimidazole carboxylase